MAEFALVLPIIVLLLVAVFDIGRAVYAYNSITNAARQGARVAVVNQLYPSDSVTYCDESMPVEDSNPTSWPTWSARACAAAAATSLGIGPAQVSIAYSTPSGVPISCPTALAPSATAPFHVGCLVSVTVSYQWTPITPIIGSLMGPITMQATSSMPIERVFP